MPAEMYLDDSAPVTDPETPSPESALGPSEDDAALLDRATDEPDEQEQEQDGQDAPGLLDRAALRQELLKELQQEMDQREQRLREEALRPYQELAQQQQTQQDQAALQRIFRQLTGSGVSAQEAGQIAQVVGRGIFYSRQEAYLGQQLKAVQTLELAAQHLPPTATLQQLREFVQAMAPHNDPESLQKQAPAVAKAVLGRAQQTAQQQRRQTLAQQRIASGAERAESGARFSGGATDERTLVARVAQGVATEAEERRLAQMWARQRLGR